MPIRGLSEKSYEAIVVGAGAAGLAAAAELSSAGVPVLVLEARDRVGGRCLTRRMPGLPVPVELGAEFIHGRPAATLSLLRRAGIAAVDSTRTQLMAFHGRLQRVNAFAEAQRAMRERGALKKKDLSFRAFLAGRRLSEKSRTLATMMVQGFDAADPAQASAREIADEWGGTAIGGSQMRPFGGYGAALEWLAHFAVGSGARLQLQTTVREVRWKRGSVEVEGMFLDEPWAAKAPRAIITLPLGVLQAGSVRFLPALREKRQPLNQLASGPVIRVALRFRSAFWEERFPGVAFFHSPRAAFPTFWTPLPMRAPLLTAWAGGPKAARLAGAASPILVKQALAAVRSVLGETPGLEATCVQDWMADPHARGGYSYVKVGGQGVREILAAPLQNTLYFAGEATDAQGEAGTVGGALQSGIRAARELIK